MTAQQAGTVFAALLAAGHLPTIYQDASGEYHLVVHDVSPNAVGPTTVAAIATAQGVTATPQSYDLT